ncbi:MAG: ribosome silencing factor [Mariniblastus sp.]
MSLLQDVCVTDESKDQSQQDQPAENPATDNHSSTEHQASGAAPSRVNPERSLELALAAAQTAAENGGSDVTVLDMSPHTAIFDYFVIVTGSSRRQLHAMSEEIDHKLEDDLNDKRMNIDGYDDSKWIVLDYGTVVIHLFDADTRVFYSLEALWADAKKVDLTEMLKNIR